MDPSPVLHVSLSLVMPYMQHRKSLRAYDGAFLGSQPFTYWASLVVILFLWAFNGFYGIPAQSEWGIVLTFSFSEDIVTTGNSVTAITCDVIFYTLAALVVLFAFTHTMQSSSTLMRLLTFATMVLLLAALIYNDPSNLDKVENRFNQDTVVAVFLVVSFIYIISVILQCNLLPLLLRNNVVWVRPFISARHDLTCDADVLSIITLPPGYVAARPLRAVMISYRVPWWVRKLPFVTSNTISYAGEVDPEGHPCGYGEWRDSAWHGEHLMGFWVRAVPRGPFRSRETGSASGIVNLRIGYVRNRGEPLAQASFMPQLCDVTYGVVCCEVSTSGAWYKSLPKLAQLIQPVKLHLDQHTARFVHMPDSLHFHAPVPHEEPLLPSGDEKQSAMHGVQCDAFPRTPDASVGGQDARVPWFINMLTAMQVLPFKGLAGAAADSHHGSSSQAEVPLLSKVLQAEEVQLRQQQQSAMAAMAMMHRANFSFIKSAVSLSVGSMTGMPMWDAGTPSPVSDRPPTLTRAPPPARPPSGFRSGSLPNSLRHPSQGSRSRLAAPLMVRRSTSWHDSRQSEPMLSAVAPRSEGLDADAEDRVDAVVGGHDEHAQVTDGVGEGGVNDLPEQQQQQQAAPHSSGAAAPSLPTTPEVGSGAASLSDEAVPRPVTQRYEALLFVHGLGTDLHKALRHFAQMMALANYPPYIAPIIFSWPSSIPVGYFFARYRAAEVPATGTALATTIRALAADGFSAVHLMVHSMGTRVLANAVPLIEQLKAPGPDYMSMEIASIIILNPDFGLIPFVSDIGPRLRRLCERVTLYGDTSDAALALSEFVNAVARPFIRRAARVAERAKACAQYVEDHCHQTADASAANSHTAGGTGGTAGVTGSADQAAPDPTSGTEHTAAGGDAGGAGRATHDSQAGTHRDNFNAPICSGLDPVFSSPPAPHGKPTALRIPNDHRTYYNGLASGSGTDCAAAGSSGRKAPSGTSVPPPGGGTTGRPPSDIDPAADFTSGSSSRRLLGNEEPKGVRFAVPHGANADEAAAAAGGSLRRSAADGGSTAERSSGGATAAGVTVVMGGEHTTSRRVATQASNEEDLDDDGQVLGGTSVLPSFANINTYLNNSRRIPGDAGPQQTFLTDAVTGATDALMSMLSFRQTRNAGSTGPDLEEATQSSDPLATAAASASAPAPPARKSMHWWQECVLHYRRRLREPWYYGWLEKSLGRRIYNLQDPETGAPLDIDVIDISYLTANVASNRHTHFALNREIIDDIWEIVVMRRRAVLRSSRLEPISANVFGIVVAPSFLEIRKL